MPAKPRRHTDDSADGRPQRTALPPLTPEEMRRWQEENAELAKAWEAWVEKHGLPLAKYRMF
ncbi:MULTISPECIES: type II toxin-antitoxin system CcdA family antitoxin [unclassified Devosia]|uniref:type II toxin-antitoxin system CcdA family antitoxin n=1 Tax=unclassified Devosia TaxID=196773 RepID=UPI001AC15DFE|nr:MULTISPECIES: type II toxin-antitoxin system CcdA family antitoxin [unclassified Devosia]MBN9305684.1 type II toxin-antitoxin system CcdA family antitoxin [Devosia sp.]